MTSDELRGRYAAIFRHAPDEERPGDKTPGEIADLIQAVRDEEMQRLRDLLKAEQHGSMTLRRERDEARDREGAAVANAHSLANALTRADAALGRVRRLDRLATPTATCGSTPTSYVAPSTARTSDAGACVAAVRRLPRLRPAAARRVDQAVPGQPGLRSVPVTALGWRSCAAAAAPLTVWLRTWSASTRSRRPSLTRTGGGKAGCYPAPAVQSTRSRTGPAEGNYTNPHPRGRLRATQRLASERTRLDLPRV